MIDGNDPRWPPDDDEEKTVFVPNPGGRRTNTQLPPMPDVSEPTPTPAAPPPLPDYRQTYAAPERFDHLEDQVAGPAISGSGINPLVAAASPLLALIATLQKTMHLADPTGLRERIERQMRVLSSDTQKTKSTPETLKAASYCMCTAIDEAVLRTPWGASSDWRKFSLLSRLHGDAWGGEKYFEILQARMRDPGPNIDLLELLYICLALGFQGKYAMLDDGDAKRRRVTDDLYQLIRRQRGQVEHDLSPHWQNEDEAKVNLDHPLPIWVVGAVAAALLLSTYIAFRFFLFDTASPTLAALDNIGHEPPTPAIEPPPQPDAPTPVIVTNPDTGVRQVVIPVAQEVKPIVPPPPPPEVDVAAKLSGSLDPEIKEGLVSVLETATQIKVRITAPAGKALFASGSDSLSPPFDAVVERIRVSIGKHQADIPGGVIVVGHTDNIPLRRSLRFQSNNELSLARATAVAELLAADKEPRIANAVEKVGKGATEPVDGGDPASGNRTKAQRAKNRRVEILIEK